jgi:integrase
MTRCKEAFMVALVGDAATFSLLIHSGRTLYEVQHILGHTQIKTTQRYAHLSQDTLLAAANAAADAVGTAMSPLGKA